jgi:multicomponent Na+:H+ antiporter subunit D
MHLAHHALMKACLFFCAGIVLTRTGKRNVSEMAGVGYQLPITMVCFTVCALAIMGTPLTVGFVSKWLIGSGALQAGQPFFIVILLISALLGAVYYFPIVYIAFFKQPEGNEHPRLQFRNEVNPMMLLPTAILAALVILAGIWVAIPGFPYSLISKVAEALFH